MSTKPNIKPNVGDTVLVEFKVQHTYEDGSIAVTGHGFKNHSLAPKEIHSVIPAPLREGDLIHFDLDPEEGTILVGTIESIRGNKAWVIWSGGLGDSIMSHDVVFLCDLRRADNS